MYSFLLIGQSNMAGRGFPSEVEPIENSRLFTLKNGRWWPMYVPVNCDRVTAGTCLAESFADLCQKEYDCDIGIIPCADGGTCLDQWMPGTAIYDHALFQAKLAMRSSTLAGVLWHQGEADCAPERYPLYEEKCIRIFEALRKDLEIEHLPFLIGGLGDFLVHCPYEPHVENYGYINAALESMAENNDYIHFVSAQGLGSNWDQLHFNSASLREFGERYFRVFKDVNKLSMVSLGKAGTEYREMEKR